MGVSHVAVVVAVLDNGGIQPGDTAEIRDINDGFLIQSERGNIKRFFLVRLLDCDIIRINAHAVFALAEHAAVLARNAAGTVVGRNGAGSFTLAHESALLVQPDNAARRGLRENIPVKAAIFDRSVVHPGDTADVFAVSGCAECAGDREIFHDAAFQHHTEKSLC